MSTTAKKPEPFPGFRKELEAAVTIQMIRELLQRSRKIQRRQEQNEVGAASGGGIGLAGAIFIVFLVLKLTGHVAWSWWWVTAPLWIPFSLCFLVILFIAFCEWADVNRC